MGKANDFSAEVDVAVLGKASIPRERVLYWIKTTTDLSTLAKLYRLTDEGYYRIQPDLGRDASCALIQRYLLQCIREGVSGNEETQEIYEAAQSLHVWFCHLLEMEDTSAVLIAAAAGVTKLFLASGADVRTAIETGFLEHVLETVALRPYFEHWSRDPNLREAGSEL